MSRLFPETPSEDEPQRPPYVRGLRVTTGVGKTSIVINWITKVIIRWRAEEEAERDGAPYDPSAKHHRRRRVLFLVPRHALGEEVRAKFLSPVLARIFRGRGARPPDAESAEDRMCLDYATVQKAQAAGEPIAETCCHGPKPRSKGSPRRKRVEIEYATCQFFNSCPYQAQKQKQGDVDVWIAAHNALFDDQATFKDIGFIVVDEGFALGGTWETDGMSLAALVDGAFPAHKLNNADYRLAETRVKLVRAFQSVEGTGFDARVPRSALINASLTEEGLETALKLQWDEQRETGAFPGMSGQARETSLRVAAGNKAVRHLAKIIEAALNLIRRDNPGAVSGRLRMAEAQVEKGAGKAHVIKVSGVKSVLKRWTGVPTLLLDATLPELSLLKRFFPDIELLDDIDVKMPAATRITQVVGAPVSDGKLMRSEGERNLEAVRHAIIAEHLKVGGALMLVVCPLKVREWLDRRGMPAEIKMAHFNGIAGSDEYKDVRLLITIGRLLPMPREVEAIAWKFSGVEGFAIPKPETTNPKRAHRVWYPKPKLAYGMRDGSGRSARAERHPDKPVETIRYQICEAEVLQAIGRGRGVNRTSANPLDIQIWADMVLPLELDEIIPWKAMQAGPEVAMARDGMFLESPTDMATVWPAEWATPDSARFWQKQKRAEVGDEAEISLYIELVYRRFSASSLTRIDYRRALSKVKRTVAWVDLTVVPDPRSWLEDRLGPLAYFEITSTSAAPVVEEAPKSDGGSRVG